MKTIVQVGLASKLNCMAKNKRHKALVLEVIQEALETGRKEARREVREALGIYSIPDDDSWI